MPDARTVRLYLAGPEVFAPDGAERAERMRETCRAHGLEPLSPLDEDALDAHETLPPGTRIFRKDIGMIDRADAVVANLSHFRGPEPDSGTAFEVGYGYGRGKRCYVFADDGATAVDRVASFYPPVSRRADGTPVDRDDVMIENFGVPFNLMLSESSTVVAGGFADAIARVAEDVAAGLFDA